MARPVRKWFRHSDLTSLHQRIRSRGALPRPSGDPRVSVPNKGVGVNQRHSLNQGSRTPVDCQAISLSTTRKLQQYQCPLVGSPRFDRVCSAFSGAKTGRYPNCSGADVAHAHLPSTRRHGMPGNPAARGFECITKLGSDPPWILSERRSLGCQRQTSKIPRLLFTARGFPLPPLLLNFYALGS